MFLLALLTCLAWATNASAVEQGQSIPAPFLGEWNTRPELCGSDTGDSRLQVSAREIGYYESRGQVLAVLRERADEIRVIARFEGEGESRRQLLHWRLSADGQVLSDVIAGDSSISEGTRRRCPAGGPSTTGAPAPD